MRPIGATFSWKKNWCSVSAIARHGFLSGEDQLVDVLRLIILRVKEDLHADHPFKLDFVDYNRFEGVCKAPFVKKLRKFLADLPKELQIVQKLIFMPVFNGMPCECILLLSQCCNSSKLYSFLHTVPFLFCVL